MSKTKEERTSRCKTCNNIIFTKDGKWSHVSGARIKHAAVPATLSEEEANEEEIRRRKLVSNAKLQVSNMRRVLSNEKATSEAHWNKIKELEHRITLMSRYKLEPKHYTNFYHAKEVADKWNAKYPENVAQVKPSDKGFYVSIEIYL